MRRPLHLTGGLGAVVGMFVTALAGLAGIVNIGKGARSGQSSFEHPSPAGSKEPLKRSYSIPPATSEKWLKGIKPDPESIRRARIRMMTTGPAQWMHLGIRTPIQGIRSKRKGRGLGGRARRRGMAR